MVDEKFVKQRFAQFRGMPGEPAEQREIRDRIDVLAGRARSEAHCEAIIQRMLETLHFFPTIANIVQAAGEVLDPQSTAAIARSRQCPYCRGDGWITQEGPFGIEVAYPCDHTGRIPERLGITLPASVQRQYAREASEAENRREEWKQLPKKQRERIQAMTAEAGLHRASQEEIERIKAAQQTNRMALEITEEDKVR